MPSKPITLFPQEIKLLTNLGGRLKLARLRRELGADTVATRARISRTTLYRAEEGSPAVAMGVYLRILVVLGLENDLAQVAVDDKLGRKLQDIGLTIKKRARKSERET
ncbi:helix-turn-helix domain-containing protein [Sulfuriferula nivalis]|uniref:helix-turn-helix domain-containing protein n=1 Tax=Sulfuriferula nivalis TaxID=2675298 RepID=UPI001389D540|nr:helix-turn-helix transcriptional regulator [Sulfuriferula nivalis]